MVTQRKWPREAAHRVCDRIAIGLDVLKVSKRF
jgi:hypothetical protein